MARVLTHPPSAACLSATMRDLGYSLETAVADLLDNSISAGADNIQIFCNLAGKDPSLVILDNGIGLSEVELIQAMRHGASNPKSRRSPKDLGRFGLGLKTASFSQCRILTMASRKSEVLSAATWNLNLIDEKDEWLLEVHEQSEIVALPMIDSLSGTGTAVIWRNLDRLSESESGELREEIIAEKLSVLRQHLSLVFHRFLAGEIDGFKRLSISVNGLQLKAFDPFCRKNSATQLLPEEVVHFGSERVSLQPYILPHHSRLSVKEFDLYRERSDFISNQGVYVYRNGRLMVWGDWFRLVPKGETTKLARVQIDFSNAMDEHWTIDIKKSRARPPLAVRERLRQIINAITNRSISVHRGRGMRLYQEQAAPMWERYADRDRVRFAINVQHPLISSLKAGLDKEQVGQLQLLIESVSAALPLEMIYSDFSTHPKEMADAQSDPTLVHERLKLIRQEMFGDGPGNAELFRRIVESARLFEGHSESIEKFIEETFN